MIADAIHDDTAGQAGSETAGLAATAADFSWDFGPAFRPYTPGRVTGTTTAPRLTGTITGG